MAEVVVPIQVSSGMTSTHTDDHRDLEGTGNPYSLNQTFAFPPQQSYPISSLGGTSSISPGTSIHRHRPSNLSLANLPPFDFGPAVSPKTLRPGSSPTRSPVRLTPPIHPQMGHKRAGSEFVGGDITGKGPVLVPTISADETKTPSAPASPARGPPTSRRGHAHRRSHAVSQSDIKFVMRPETQGLSGSLPVTPFEEPNKFIHMAPQKATSHDTMRSHNHSRSTISSSAPSLASRNRVEFSDTPEYIPRPLSTISSDTSSSMSTIRANHSTSESVSSLNTTGFSSPSSLRGASGSGARHTSGDAEGPLIGNNVHMLKSPRAVLQNPSNIAGRQRQDDLSEKRLQAPLNNQEQEEQHDLVDPFNFDQVSPFSNMPPSLNDGAAEIQSASPCKLEQVSPQLRPRTSPETKSSSKPQRVKSWADNILHRREKTSPSSTLSMSEHDSSEFPDTATAPHFSLDDMSFDDDTTMIIEEPTTCAPRTSTSRLVPGRHEFSPEIPTPSPMIDLDFAMTFSNLSSDDTSEHGLKAAGAKRRLHSSGETGGFMGPGMHYHRRAESAPEMEPFERPRLGFPRLGSNPAMEEAIVEEDEEVTPDDGSEESHALGLGVNIVDEDIHSNERPDQSRVSRRASSSRVIRRISTPPDTLPMLAVNVADLEEEPRFSMITKSSDDSSITPSVSPNPLGTRPVSAPLDFAVQTPSLIYGTTPETPSAVSSADYRQTSFDLREPRLHTARSSMTDRVTLNSSKAGDTSAGSLEDVPSLTSSASTMISSLRPRNSGSKQFIDPAVRSASFSGPTVVRGRPGSSGKRASLASLSKLMGGTYNRSKLNIAETLRPDSPLPEKSQGKKKRISRMMKFWKSKETLSSR